MKTTEKLLEMYGTTWYKFDEVTGSSIDAINSNIANIYGSDRVTGWNGQGYAINFDGNNSYITQTAHLSSEENTIRFRFKTSTLNTTYFMSTLNSFATQNGMAIYIEDGKIGVGWTANLSGVFAFMPTTTELRYNDNQWHDLLFYWDGKKDSFAYLYIDDTSSPVIKVKADYNNGGHMFPAFTIGGLSGVSLFRYNGQIDDFQVYSKALPSYYFSYDKTLVLHDGKYKNFLSDWSVVSSTLPTSQQFLSDGMEDLSVFNRQVTTLEPLPMTDKSEILASGDVGKVFSKILDLKKLMDIRNIKVEVE